MRSIYDRQNYDQRNYQSRYRSNGGDRIISLMVGYNMNRIIEIDLSMTRAIEVTLGEKT